VRRVPARGEAVYGVSIAGGPSALLVLAARCGLSPAETTVLDALAGGLSNRELASTLCISAHTVKTHVHRILGKLGVRSRVQAALLARGADRGAAAGPAEGESRVVRPSYGV
jgi:DNA-binding CsgD family transcriptional regulator